MTEGFNYRKKPTSVAQQGNEIASRQWGTGERSQRATKMRERPDFHRVGIQSMHQREIEIRLDQRPFRRSFLRDSFASLFIRHCLLPDRFPASHKGNRSEDNRHYQSGCDTSEKHPLPPRSRLAACDNVFGLERRRLALLIHAGLGKPLLGGTQILAAKHEAVAFLVRFPFERAGEYPGVGVDPLKVGI